MDRPFSYSPPQAFTGKQAWFGLSFLLLIVLCLLNLSDDEMAVVLLLPGIPLLLFAFPDPKKWLLLLPLGIALGYPLFSLGPIPVVLAAAILLTGYVVYFTAKAATLDPFPPLQLWGKVVMVAYGAQLASLAVSLYVHEQHFLNALRESHKIFISAPLAFIIADWYATRRGFDTLVKALVVTLLVTSIYGNIQFFSGKAVSLGEVAAGYDIAGRAFSTFRGGANAYSGYLELMVPLALAAGFHFRTSTWKFLAWSGAALGFQNGLLTYSRGAFLMLSLACLAYLLFRFRRTIWIPITLLTLLAGIITLNADKLQRQLSLLVRPETVALEATIVHRYTTYAGFIRDIKANPVYGVGWGANPFYSSGSSLFSFWEIHHERSITDISWFGGLNNLFFDMALKGGLFSSASLMLLILAVIVASSRALRSRKTSDLGVGIVSGMVAFWVHHTMDNLLHWPQTGAFFWIILGLLGVMGTTWNQEPVTDGIRDIGTNPPES